MHKDQSIGLGLTQRYRGPPVSCQLIQAPPSLKQLLRGPGCFSLYLRSSMATPGRGRLWKLELRDCSQTACF